MAAVPQAPLAPPPAITISIDRLPLASDLPPFADHGTLLVPARAIFDALGAQVRYDIGTGKIVVVRGVHSARLTIGRTAASVDGRSIVLPAAPRVVAAHVFVPLRFISEALGGASSFDPATHVVSITGAGETPSAHDPLAIGTAEAALGVTVASQSPAPGSSVPNALPAISGEFQTRGGPDVDPDSVRMSVDGVDETPLVRRQDAHFGFTPGEPLEPGEHEVDVNGLDRAGTPFDIHWTFTVSEHAAYEPPVMTLAPGSEGSGVGMTYEDAPYDYGANFVISEPLVQYGNSLQFSYAAPPGGSGFVSLCGISGAYPFRYDPGTRRYLADVAVPAGVYAPNCYVSGTFVGPGGTTRLLPPISPIAIDTTRTTRPRVAPAATPSPDVPFTTVPSTLDTRTLPPAARVPGDSPSRPAPVVPGTPLVPAAPVLPASPVALAPPFAPAAVTPAPPPETRFVRPPLLTPIAPAAPAAPAVPGAILEPRRSPLTIVPPHLAPPSARPAMPVRSAQPPPRRAPTTAAH